MGADREPGKPLLDCAAPFPQRRAEGTVDLGTGFDCFDAKSAPTSTNISADAQRNRQTLTEAMTKAGFRGARSAEWWHFTLNGEPFPDTYFDFPVTGHFPL